MKVRFNMFIIQGDFMVIFQFLISIVIVLILVSRKVNIGISMFIGGIVLGFLSGLTPLKIVGVVFESLIEKAAVSLALTIMMITILGELMEKFKLMDKMIESLEQMLKSAKVTIMVAPALIGTLLVTGGALMSCPVVNSLGEKLEISNDRRASINLIFRHAMYFIFPFGPTLVLAAELAEVSIRDLILIQMPVAIAMYIIGYIIYLRDAKEKKQDSKIELDIKKIYKYFTFYSAPIWVSFVGVLVFNVPFYISLGAGILVAMAIHYSKGLEKAHEITGDSILTLLKNGIKPKMVIAVLGIMFFKNIVNSTDGMHIFLSNLVDSGLPIELIIIVACALISYPLASTQPSVAILYPMILPLAGTYEIRLLYAMFIYVSAFVFYYVSPLHMCQVLTLEYFDVRIKSLYKNYAILLPAVYGVMIIVYIISMHINTI